MSNNKQSSVEWLIAELGEYFPHEIGGIELMVRKAKAMHKEEIMEAYHDGINLEYHLDMPSPKQYYEQTYGGNK
jgi:hypothetical protein